jgi:probable phosphoglycerate mutase
VGETRIILVRHGETEWNSLGLYQGQLDSPLTRQGLRQARALARRLRRYSTDSLYSSDLERARATAAPIAQATGLEVNTDPRLRERHLGVFQGLDKAVVQEKYPHEYAAYTSGDPDYCVPGGESSRQFLERALSCLEELAARHPAGHLVVVTHGGVLGMVLKHVLGLPIGAPRRFAMPNTGFNLISRNSTGWRLETLGDTSHLRELENSLDDSD